MLNWPKFLQIGAIRNISFIGMSNILGSGISAIFWLYIADLLGSENYGEISYLMGIGGIVTSLSLLGSESSITVFSAKKINLQSTIYLISLISGLISATILYVAFQHLGLSFFVLGYVVYILTFAEILGRKLYKKYSIYFIIQKILFVSLSLIFYFIIGSEGILLGYGLSMLLLVKIIFRSFSEMKIDLNLLKTKSHFMINNYILSISKTTKGQIDKILIAPLFGFAILGNYFLAIQFLSILGIIPGIITKYTLPEDASGVSTTKIKLFTVCISIGLALFGIFIMPMIVPIFFPTYIDALEIIPIISISIFPSTISSLYVSKLIAMEKTKFVVIGYMISFSISVTGILSLGTIFHIPGLAYTLVISSSSQALYFVWLNVFKLK